MEYMHYIGTLMPQLMEGLKITLKLFLCTLVLSVPLGLILSLGRISRFKPLAWLINGYLWIFRGTPLMLQLYFVYFGLTKIAFPGGYKIVLASFPAALITFVLNYSAYFAEIFRGGILSVSQGQYEAAKALGFTPVQTTWYIVLPQMLRTVIPPVANETLVLVKDTALASTISVIDMLKKATQAVNRDMDITAYVLVAAIYLAITLVLTFMFNKIEKRMAISERKN